MNRRSFLRRLGAVVVGLTLARELPGIAPAPPKVAFDPKAFMAAFHGDIPPTRFDVIYGWGAIRPDLAARVIGEVPVA